MRPIGKRSDAGSLPVVVHCLDVACCMQALLEQPVIADRVSTALGYPVEAVCEYLTCVAFLHDIGKLSRGFQARIHAVDGERWAGHLHQAAWPWWIGQGPSHCIERGLAWLASDEDRVVMMASLMAHHGRPISNEAVSDATWQPCSWYDPVAALGDFAASMERLFPSAILPDEGFSLSPAFQHLFTGLLTLADQIGSREDFFPMNRDCANRDETMLLARQAISAVGLDGVALRSGLSSCDDTELFGWGPGARLKPMQQMLRDMPVDRRLITLESETGSGKTEAACLRFRTLLEAGAVDGMFFGAPTRSAVIQLHGRVDRVSRRLLGQEAVLAVPGMMRAGEATGLALPDFRVLWSDCPDQDRMAARWSAETGRRFLASTVAVGTIDQFLLSGLQVKWAHMRGASLARSLLVVDEVHASDAYMQAILKSAVDGHLAIGGHVLLMSATLGSHARASLLGVKPSRRKKDVGYPAISWLDKDRKEEAFLLPPQDGRIKAVEMSVMRVMEDPARIAAEALAAVRQGGRVMVIRNTVSAAVAVFDAILAADPAAPLLSVNGCATLHHSRFAAEDRKRLDQAVEAALHPRGEQSPVIVVGTQTIEQSLDIDGDVLFCDVCPIDVLLQRIGRLHRHVRDRPEPFRVPSCTVLFPEVMEPGRRLSRFGIGIFSKDRPEGVYPDLVALRRVDTLIREKPVWVIPAMNRELVERGTDPDLLHEEAMALGTAWSEHHSAVGGANFAKKSKAGIARLDRTAFFSFEQGLFPAERLATRLGLDNLDIDLPAPVIGPFGEPVSRFSIPFHMAVGAEADFPVIAAEGRDLFLSMGERHYRYSPRGLEKIA